MVYTVQPMDNKFTWESSHLSATSICHWSFAFMRMMTGPNNNSPPKSTLEHSPSANIWDKLPDTNIRLDKWHGPSAWSGDRWDSVGNKALEGLSGSVPINMPLAEASLSGLRIANEGWRFKGRPVGDIV